MDIVLPKSLFAKQAVYTLVLAIFLSLIISLIQVIDGAQGQKKQIDKDFYDLLTVVEKPLAEAVFRIDKSYAQQQINSLLINQSIAHVEIRDDFNKLFVEATALPEKFAISQALSDYFLPEIKSYKRELVIEQPKFHAGTLIIIPDKRFILEQILDKYFSSLIYNLFKDLLLASLLSLVFYFLVIYPLKRLTKLVSASKSNEPLPLSESFYRHHKYDELGKLHSTFASLWDKLNIALNDLEYSHTHTKAMIEHAADGVLLIDESKTITLANAAAERLFKVERGYLEYCLLEKIQISPSWKGISDFPALLEKLTTNSPITVETIYHANGVEIPLEFRLAKYCVQDKTEVSLLIRNISDRREAEAHIHALAYYDKVTGLPNRQFLIEKLSEILDKQKMYKSCAAVIFMDLDRFKIINDSLGHNVGDQLLRCVAKQILPLVNNNVIFSRMGGDEFAFLMTALDREDGQNFEKTVNDFMSKIVSTCQQVKTAGHHEVHITASLGASIFDGNESQQEVVLKQADTALYKAKASGKNTYALYEESMQAISDARLEMEKALHDALALEQFELYYQPQVNHLGELVGAEALIRWQHESKGFISPADFIPVAEEIGLIVDIGQWVLDSALSQIAVWIEQGEWQATWRMSINVSPIQFQQAGFLPLLKAKLEKHKVPSHCVDLEITENMLLDDLSSCLEKMNAIKDLGVYLSIDDFGTGYSSLKYLKSLPIDRLKIDQSFIRDLLKDKSDEAIVHAVIAMAKALHINVLAEGVETLAHYERLHEIKCFYYQGYYFGHPLPPARFISEFVHGSCEI